MEIFPAIDLKGGQVVRLTQGDYDRVEVYGYDPAEIARQFVDKGAKNLHVVDLDGARDGGIVNFDAIRSIISVGGLFVEIGGGIRDEDGIRRYLDIGGGRVILGTVALEDFGFLCRMVGKYGDKIAVGVDARDEKVAVRGWLETTQADSVDFCKRLESAGVSTVIYTDISRDGAMKGTNLDIYRRLSDEVGLKIIASGGVSGMEEIKSLKETGVHGVILGKALYTGALKLEEVLQLC